MGDLRRERPQRRTTAARSYWVRINRREDDQPPLFLVHAIDGTPMPFMQLARAASCPVYGASAPGLHPNDEPVPTIESLAEVYSAQLRAIAPKGRYRLGGYCSGAMIALEMARQLSAGGDVVLPLVLVDPTVEPYELAPNARAAGIPARRRLLYRLAVERASSGDRASLEPLLEQLELPAALARGAVGLRMLSVISANYAAWMEYRAVPYAGDIILFLAHEPPGARAIKLQAWSDIALGDIAVHIVPGNHETVLHGANARLISSLLV